MKFIKGKNNKGNITANIVNITYKTSNDKYFICVKAKTLTPFSSADIHSYIYHQETNDTHYIHSKDCREYLQTKEYEGIDIFENENRQLWKIAMIIPSGEEGCLV